MKSFIACLLFIAVLAGCGQSGRTEDQVAGSGNRKKESRTVSDFNRIEVEGAYRVEVVCGQPLAVEVEADDNLLPLISTDVAGGRLRIRNERGLSTQAFPHVRISVPDVNEVSIPGASEMRITGTRNERLTLDVSGASKLHASGETGSLNLKLSGAGLIDTRELRARDASVQADGAGRVSVHATESLEAVVNGVGSIDYYGDPKKVSQKVNGIGTINRK